MNSLFDCTRSGLESVSYEDPASINAIKESTSSVSDPTLASTYQDIMQILDQAYIKLTSSVYNSHKLISYRQQPGQSVDNYMLELQRLSKSCNFNQVTAEEYCKEYIWDASINGIQSTVIRQILLEQWVTYL